MSHAPLELGQVHRLATLARLDLTQDEERRVMQDLEQILGHVDKLAQANTTQAPATCHGVELEGHLRPDVIAPSLPLADVLRNAPEPLGDGFGVPKILE